MMKQISKQILTMLAFVLPLLGGGVLGQALDQRIVSDPLTGIALYGMDPVSYFVEETPQRGKPAHEFIWHGVAWHFASAANADVFERAPEIYTPQYGGHGAMGVSRGFLSDGDPNIYLVFKARLYLFYSAANREAFKLAPDAAALAGVNHWPNLVPLLTTK